ncbi:hypothetical protein Ciccas_007197 [Cichlidogyrus casuarinus]|uniref:Uncharacterized protein n=1 Tax=Cichlidogyrus casuarinus TaxID=1844966 RepID=A0ABD2Q3J5_9PLAT
MKEVNEMNEENLKNIENWMEEAKTGSPWLYSVYGPKSKLGKFYLGTLDPQLNSTLRDKSEEVLKLIQNSPWPAISNKSCFARFNDCLRRWSDIRWLMLCAKKFRSIRLLISSQEKTKERVLPVDEPWKLANQEIVLLHPYMLTLDLYRQYCNYVEKFCSEISPDIIDALTSSNDLSRQFYSHFNTLHIRQSRLETEFGDLLMGSLIQSPTLEASIHFLQLFEGICDRPKVLERIRFNLNKMSEDLQRSVASIGAELKDLEDFSLDGDAKSSPTSKLNHLLRILEAKRSILSSLMEQVNILTQMFSHLNLNKIKSNIASLLESITKMQEKNLLLWSSSYIPNPEYIEEFINKPLIVSTNESDLVVSFDPQISKFFEELNWLMKIFPEYIPDEMKMWLKDCVNSPQTKRYAKELATHLKNYNKVHKTIQPHERLLLSKSVEIVDQILLQGLTTLTWSMREQIFPFVEDVGLKIEKLLVQPLHEIKNSINGLEMRLLEWNHLEIHVPSGVETYDTLGSLIPGDKIDVVVLERAIAAFSAGQDVCRIEREIVQVVVTCLEVAELSIQSTTAIEFLHFVSNLIRENSRKHCIFNLHFLSDLLGQTPSLREEIGKSTYCFELNIVLKYGKIVTYPGLSSDTLGGKRLPELIYSLIVAIIRYHFRIPVIGEQLKFKDQTIPPMKLLDEPRESVSLITRSSGSLRLQKVLDFYNNVEEEADEEAEEEEEAEDETCKSSSGRDLLNTVDEYDLGEEILIILEWIIRGLNEDCIACVQQINKLQDYSFLWMHETTEVFKAILCGKTAIKMPMNGLNRFRKKPCQSPLLESSEMLTEEENRNGSPTLADFIEELELYKVGGLLLNQCSGFDGFHITELVIGVPMPPKHPGIRPWVLFRCKELNEIDPKLQVGAICLDYREIREVLISLTRKWVKTFKQYLTHQVVTMLQNTETFIQRIEDQVQELRNGPSDTLSTMRLLRLFNQVTGQSVKIETKFNVMRKIIALLMSSSNDVEQVSHTGEFAMDALTNLFETREALSLFQDVPKNWMRLRANVQKVKQELEPQIIKDSEIMRKDLESFSKSIATFREDLLSSDAFKASCPQETAVNLCDTFHRRLSVLRDQAKDLHELHKLLHEQIFDPEMLEECDLMLTNLREVRRLMQDLLEKQNEWTRLGPSKGNLRLVKSGCEALMEKVQQLPQLVHQWDLYQILLDGVNNWLQKLPLISNLTQAPMRTRHWKQLLQSSSNQLTSTTRLVLGELVELAKMIEASEIEKIAERATMDFEVEKQLRNFEAAWTSKNFQLKALDWTDKEFFDRITVNPNDAEVEANIELPEEPNVNRANRDLTLSRVSLPRSLAHLVDNDYANEELLATAKPNGRESTKQKLQVITGYAVVTSLPGQQNSNSTQEPANFSPQLPILCELARDQILLQKLLLQQEFFNGDDSKSSPTGDTVGSVNTFFTDEIKKWQLTLKNVEQLTQLWLQVQKAWCDVIQILQHDQMRRSLRIDLHELSVLNKDIILLFRATAKNPNVLRCCERKSEDCIRGLAVMPV